MYRVCAKLSEQASAKHVFQAPCQVRAFVQELQKQYPQAFSEPIDIQRMTEIVLIASARRILSGNLCAGRMDRIAETGVQARHRELPYPV